MFCRKLLQSFVSIDLRFCRFIRRDFLDRYGQLFRPEVQADLEHLAVETSRNKDLEINYQVEEQRRRKRTVRFHILRRKYVAHPSDVQVDLFVKNQIQFLHKNYPSRWTVEMLAQSFDQTEENIRLILQQRASRRLRVRPKPLATTFGINDKEEKDKLIEQHLLQRDIKNYKSTKIDDEPVDSRVLAEENRILSRERPSEIYLSKENDGFFSNIIAKATSSYRLTAETTLLDRMNKIRFNDETKIERIDEENLHESKLNDERMKILNSMQKQNDRIAEKNDQKRKFVQRIKKEKN